MKGLWEASLNTGSRFLEKMAMWSLGLGFLSVVGIISLSVDLYASLALGIIIFCVAYHQWTGKRKDVLFALAIHLTIWAVLATLKVVTLTFWTQGLAAVIYVGISILITVSVFIARKTRRG